MFHNKVVKISEKYQQAELVENLPPRYLNYWFLHDLASFLLCGKVEMEQFDFKKAMTRIKLFVHR